VIFSEAVARLERAFHHELPGPNAQARMAPVPRREWPPQFNPAHIRNAAGLLLVFPSADDRPSAHIVLTVRGDSLERHGGQVSLPGGVVDPGETFEQAALREAHEEIALTIEGIKVLGELTPLDIPVSGFRLHPVVAAAPVWPTLSPADGEVARILEIDIDELLNPSCVVQTRRERDGVSIAAPAFRVAGVEIWGATAMVLAEFLALLGWTAADTA
jgi:8-oxo-dGTP pyrophosphatase MutT (NUDIX family)